MLERTAAASVETCSFQKVLPTAPRLPLTSRRRLHTAFWSHGASDFELLDACRTLILQPAPRRNQTIPSNDNPKNTQLMTASTFLLDFLYPTAAVRFFQRTYLSPFTRLEPGRSLGAPSRLLSSLTDSSAPNAAGPSDDLQGAASYESLEEETEPRLPPETGDGITDSPALVSQPPVAVSESSSRWLQQELGRGLSGRQVVEQALASGRGKSFDLLLMGYSSLGPEEQAEFKPTVIAHLSDSTRGDHLTRLLDLFHTLETEKWTPPVVEGVLKVLILLGDEPAALQLTKTALLERDITSTIDLVLAFALKDGRWDFAMEVVKLNAQKSSSCEPSKFTHLAETFTFRSGLVYLQKHVKWKHSRTYKDFCSQMDILFKDIATTSLTLFPNHVDFILQRAGDFRNGELHLVKFAEEGRGWLAVKLYRHFRKTRGFRPEIETLRAMTRVLRRLDVRMLEQVMEDWYAVHGHMDAGAYEKMAYAYAEAGEVEAVSHLTKEWFKHHPEHVKKDLVGWAATRVLAVAVKGNVAETKRVYEEEWEKLKPLMHAEEGVEIREQPRLMSPVLRAHAAAWDYEGCIETFTRLCEVSHPNSKAFEIVMEMAARRGDLDAVRQLYELAVQRLGGVGREPGPTILNWVVEAYCRNDQYDTAVTICRTTTKKLSQPNDSVVLWNTLLRHYAVRRNLGELYRTLEIMTEYGVAYTQTTYANLIRGMGLCRQGSDALHLYRSLTREGTISPSATISTFLLEALIEDGELDTALQLAAEIGWENFGQSAKLTSALIKALTNWKRISQLKKLKGFTPEVCVSTALELFYAYVKEGRAENVNNKRANAWLYRRMLFMLMRAGKHAEIDKILGLWRQQFGDAEIAGDLPVTLLDSMLLNAYYRKDYDQAMQLWEVLFERVARESRQSPSETRDAINDADENQKVHPLNRFRLEDSIRTMLRVYLDKKDPDGLMLLVGRIREAGFDLERKGWNFYVQMLATLGYRDEAFRVCEAQLMPNWTGWLIRRGKLPLEVRRLAGNPYAPWPTSYTLLSLAREYKQWKRGALWSDKAGMTLSDIEVTCPRTIHAVSTVTLSRLERDRALLAGQEESGEHFDPEAEAKKILAPSQPDTVKDRDAFKFVKRNLAIGSEAKALPGRKRSAKDLYKEKGMMALPIPGDDFSLPPQTTTEDEWQTDTEEEDQDPLVPATSKASRSRSETYVVPSKDPSALSLGPAFEKLMDRTIAAEKRGLMLMYKRRRARQGMEPPLLEREAQVFRERRKRVVEKSKPRVERRKVAAAKKEESKNQ
ncbi:hypothetical protein QBC47DRAFT_371453 [Echria macrotheca]|uniref:Uncharacterized protein n=1 Tax=Echria macrotheca TaxID=438768 RepID=A0AAJ0BJU1_9PEZI|nr:hypothetical protein QBC47DRAFT_371453 [Echria macrotheca]